MTAFVEGADFRVPRGWRISQGPGACDFHMYFDAMTEVPGVRALTADEKAVTLDSVSSVSALPDDDDPEEGLGDSSSFMQLPLGLEIR